MVDDRLFRNLIRQRFMTLDAAVNFATEEQRADRTFQMYRQTTTTDEPMDIDVVRQDKDKTELTEIKETIEKLTRQMDRVSRQIRQTPNNPNQRRQAIQYQGQGQQPRSVSLPSAGPMPDFSRPPPPVTGNRHIPNRVNQYQWTEDGKPVCAACGKVGHIRRKCRSQQTEN